MFTLCITDLPHPYNKIGDGPEVGEVARAADGLRKCISGKEILEIRLTKKAKHVGLDTLVLPKKVQKVESLGKKILIYLEGNIILANELIMTGRWSTSPCSHATGRWKDGGCEHLQYTLIYRGKKGIKEKIYFISIRNWSKTFVLRTEEEKAKYFDRLGPDVLKNIIPKDQWLERMRTMTKKRKGSRPFLICDVLLEQRIFAGVGNFIRAEAMYLAKIKPDRPVTDVSDEELDVLRHAVHFVARESYRLGGFSMRDYFHVDGTRGGYKTLVYNQKKDPRGNPVIKSLFKGKWPKRYVHWVPDIQK